MNLGASSATAAATGTLTKNTHRQDIASTITPPSSRPAPAPSPSMAANTPTALLRAAPAVNVETISDSAVACANAALAPCSTRATISRLGLQDSPASIEAAANEVREPMKTRRRPSRSPLRPPSRSSAPKVSA